MTNILCLMKIKKTDFILIVAVLLLYTSNRLLNGLMSGWAGYFCQCHFNDLICPLLFLSYCQIVLTLVGLELRTYFDLIAVGMSAGWIWEYFAPVINQKAVSDPVDLLCYFGGINLYYIVIRFWKSYEH